MKAFEDQKKEHTQAEKDQALFDKIKQRGSDISSEIKAGANVHYFDETKGTPLMYALQLNKLSKIKPLLEAGSQVGEINLQWKSPLTSVFNKVNEKSGQEQKNYFIALKQLLKKYKPMAQADIQSWVLQAQRYWHDDRYHPDIVLDVLASYLIGTKVTDLYTKDNFIKYMGHINLFEGKGRKGKEEKYKKVDLGLWGPVIYLSLRTRALLQLLFDYYNSFKDDQAIQPIFVELGMNLKTLFVADITHKIHTLALTPQQKEELYQAVTTHILQHIAALKEEEDY